MSVDNASAMRCPHSTGFAPSVRTPGKSCVTSPYGTCVSHGTAPARRTTVHCPSLPTVRSASRRIDDAPMPAGPVSTTKADVVAEASTARTRTSSSSPRPINGEGDMTSPYPRRMSAYGDPTDTVMGQPRSPPATGSTVPVMYDASSEARKQIAAACSSSVP